LTLTVQVLTGTDLTKGDKIAGTGALEVDGKVSEIGGVEYKVRTIHKEGDFDVFFVPKFDSSGMLQFESSSENVALKTAEQLGVKFNVVPVSSLYEAIQYLNKLPTKTLSD
jgi:PDZ domain-containing protein